MNVSNVRQEKKSVPSAPQPMYLITRHVNRLYHDKRILALFATRRYMQVLYKT